MKEPFVSRECDDMEVAADAVDIADVSLDIHTDFETMLANRPGVAVAIADLPKLAFEHGRVLIQSPPGAGKSTLLSRLEAMDNVATRVIRLGGLSTEERHWESEGDVESWLLNELGDPSGQLLLCIDGLDEVPLHDGQRLLDAVEQITSGTPQVAIILTDRLGRRSVRTSRWLLVTLGVPRGLSTDLVTGARHDGHAWKRLPYYEQMVRLIGPESSASPTELIERFLTYQRLPHMQSRESLEQVSRVAFEAWVARTSTMTTEFLAGKLSNALLADLWKARLLYKLDSATYSFAHLLLHSYFASRYLASRPELWRKGAFEALTLDGANYEGLGMLLNQVKDDQVDELVRRVDDWNFYAAGFLLAEDFDSGERTSDALRSALLLLLGRRRFSSVPSTRIQVEDTLRLHGGDFAELVLTSVSIGGLVGLAESLSFDAPWWDSWRDLFCSHFNDSPPTEALDAIEGEDGLSGWTAANVLSTSKLTEAMVRSLVSLASSSTEESVRWRAIHALGGTPSLDSIDAFLDRIQRDRSSWVRNSALRSFMQVTAMLPDSEMRSQSFVRLAEDAELLLQNPKWLREIERSSRLERAPEDWPRAVGILLEELWSMSRSVEEQDRWRSLSASLRTEWNHRDKLGTL